MDKKIIAIILVAVGLLAVAVGAIFFINSGNENRNLQI